MPFTRESATYALRHDSAPNSSGVITSTYTSMTLPIKETNFPSAAYRKMPLDLFAGSTARNTSSFRAADSTCTIPTKGGLPRYTGAPIRWAYDFNYWNLPTVALPNSDVMLNTIRNELRGKAANLAMALGEYRQTAQLFAEAAKIVATKGKSLAHGFHNKRTASRTVARRWLEFQYGVKPLVNDINDSIEMLRQGLNRPIYFSGKLRRTAKGSRTFTLYDTAGRANKAEASVDVIKQISIKWRARMNPNGLQSTLHQTGFGNPFALAYELTPYSFVLDWWINVGEVLSSLDNLTLCSDLSVIVGTREITNQYVRPSQGGFAYESRITTARYAPQSVSRVNSLVYKPSVSVTHILNGLALLRLARKA